MIDDRIYLYIFLYNNIIIYIYIFINILEVVNKPPVVNDDAERDVLQ